MILTLNPKYRLHLLFCIVGLSQMPTTIYSTTILVDFGSSELGPSSIWNIINNPENAQFPATSNLIDANTGNPTNVGIVGDNWNSGITTGSGFASLPVDWLENAVIRDGFIGSPNSSITFVGLPEAAFTIELFVADKNDAHIQNITIDDTFATSNHANAHGPTTLGNQWRPNTDGTLGQNWLVWNEVQAKNGQVRIDFEEANDVNNTLVNGVRLTFHASEVPDFGPTLLWILLLLAAMATTAKLNRLISQRA